MSSCIVALDENCHHRFLQDSCLSFLHNDSSARSPRNPLAALPESAKDPSYSSSVPVSGSMLLMKRKRPPSLQIPEGSRVLCSSTPSVRRSNDESTVAYSAAGCAVYAKKGKVRDVMEDSHKIISGYRGDPKKGFFGVYDGHGGRNAAEYVAENLHKHVLEMAEKYEGLSKVEAAKSAYLRTDKEFLSKGLNSGVCCVTAFIEDGEIIVSNLGDCRAVICRGGVAEALTCDHRASREDEQARIEAQGGYVDIHHGTWRVDGVLAVTRSIGDRHLKEWVLAEPDSKGLVITDDMELLILASDGLWEKVGNQEAVDTVMNLLLESKSSLLSMKETTEGHDEQRSENIGSPLKMRRTSNLHGIKAQRLNQENLNPNQPPPMCGFLVACKELVGLAAKRGNLDDITVMIIDLKHFICS
ncbi:probable protein phosphatase 2C 14 [Nymphaea colorata]|nr:probable protein phosphatase 2C 14 [Nymphaea colorata]